MSDLEVIVWIGEHFVPGVMTLIATILLVWYSLNMWSDIQARNFSGKKWERRTEAFGNFMIEFPFWVPIFLFWCFCVYWLFHVPLA